MFFSACLQKSQDAGPNELRLMHLLFPHMQRAARLYLQFSAVQRRSQALETMLDEVSLGCVLLDAGRKIAFTNGLAGRLTTERDGLEIRQGRLTASHGASSENLEREIAGAFALAEGKRLAPNGVLALPRPSGKPPYVIYVVPIGLHTPDPALSLGLFLPAVAIFINDPARQAVTPQAVIQGHYGLTPAEARLAFAFLQTASLKKSAEYCSIKESSARQYMKRIFQKTETRSQPELMKLLLSHIVGR
jgi:DNA-binding CsgD family transcriptional regulator